MRFNQCLRTSLTCMCRVSCRPNSIGTKRPTAYGKCMIRNSLILHGLHAMLSCAAMFNCMLKPKPSMSHTPGPRMMSGGTGDA